MCVRRLNLSVYNKPRMPSHLISPPAVVRKVPLSRPVGHTLTHVSVSAVHADLIKKTVQAPVSGPTYVVTQTKAQ